MLTALRLLVLDDNQLSGTLPTEIGKLANLQVLWLQYNQLSGVLPTELANLEKLEPVQSSCLLSPNRFNSSSAWSTNFGAVAEVTQCSIAFIKRLPLASFRTEFQNAISQRQ